MNDRKSETEDEYAQKLRATRIRLKTGEHDGVDIMTAWLAIDALLAAHEQIIQLKALLAGKHE